MRDTTNSLWKRNDTLRCCAMLLSRGWPVVTVVAILVSRGLATQAQEALWSPLHSGLGRP